MPHNWWGRGDKTIHDKIKRLIFLPSSPPVTTETVLFIERMIWMAYSQTRQRSWLAVLRNCSKKPRVSQVSRTILKSVHTDISKHCATKTNRQHTWLIMLLNVSHMTRLPLWKVDNLITLQQIERRWSFLGEWILR